MVYKKFDDTIIVKLEPNDEICESLLKIAKSENITLAHVSGMGAVNDFSIGVFNARTKEHYPNDFKGNFEIVSLEGNITVKDNEPYLHLHFSAADKHGDVVGGHLNKAVISAMGEIFIRIISGKVERKFNEDVGLNLFDF